MREKLNENPKAQAAVVAVLVVLAAFLYLTRMGGGEQEESPTTEATVAVAGSEATGTAVGSSPGEAVEAAAQEAVAAASSQPGPGASVPSSLPATIEAPPPPKDVTQAYEDDKTVVLLVVHNGGIDDGLVKLASQTLLPLSEVALFIVPAKQVYRYASITLGVEVSRVPALVVMRPRNLNEGKPQASVSYGFQTPQDIRQAVRDAGYHGPSTDYHPD